MSSPFNGDCEGEAIFTLVENTEIISEVRADIHDVQDSIILAERAKAQLILIDGVYFDTAGISNILADLASDRISSLMDNFMYALPLKDVVALENQMIQMHKKVKK